MSAKQPITPYVFLVRDLASGNNLLSLPVPSRELHHVTAALSALFLNLGAPLVLKSDCEFDTSRFAASDQDSNMARQLLAQLLVEHRVFHLLSPPYTPEYNASIEAGIENVPDTRSPRGRPSWSCWRMEL